MATTAVIGAGPAGLTAGLALGRGEHQAVIFEQNDLVGGISRTEEYQGFRFDIGGHRFFTKIPRVEAIWRELLDDELLERDRLSRIHYRGRFFHYPLKPVNALVNLGPVEAVRVVASYARARLRPQRPESSFEDWVVNRFGRRLYEIFFETYTEKVWGIPPSEIGAEWAAQRIKNLDLPRAVWQAIVGSSEHDGEVVTTLIDRFLYPRLGPGQMWERCRERTEQLGVPTVTGARVTRLVHEDGRIREIEIRHQDRDEPEHVSVKHVLSSMPLRTLVRSLDPAPPEEILAAADALSYRDFLTVALLVDRPELFPDNWIYVHSPQVRVGRIQNFKNWSPHMVPDPGVTSLGLEYFTHVGDDLWSTPDDELLRLGETECRELGLLGDGTVTGGTVLRCPKAYPVYDQGYQQALATLRGYLDRFENLACIGRNGQHRYNNQDHSMLTALYAVENLEGADHDLWSVNTEPEYHEAGTRPQRDQTTPSGDRQVPQARQTPQRSMPPRTRIGET